ncbi:hypothetical protein DICPUDRAFT_30729 [Dictyostelium purpureum]|uniref:Uncharacterized protein n=1 Tax=Dictyostelium purpureum TaxID=5786 RepID=F0ZFW9_DICPU|nr:uncharacterized protein DICPUDRAFT_30729 [Dictyostelium purpureum]EGC37166.1 hypothetical protein DICPUDRAFT_30729 [Dictyostelium purpureum]|eukprot:XP_003286294.1 hypothetical protein DICPUDRAFT_30729 [Dictyostelium purpureum]
MGFTDDGEAHNDILLIDENNINEIINKKLHYWEEEFSIIKMESHDQIKQISNSSSSLHELNFQTNDINCDLPEEVFKNWYQFAISYVESLNSNTVTNDMELEIILSIKVVLNFMIDKEILLNSSKYDDGVFRKYLEQFRKVLTILLSKPKFTMLFVSRFEQGPSTNFIKDQIKNSLQILINSIQRASTLSKKMEILNSIQSIVDIGNKLTAINLCIDFYFNSINIIQPLILFANSLDHGEVLRNLSIKILSNLPKDQYKSDILKQLSLVSTDSLTLNYFWSNDGIFDKESISILQNRIPPSSKEFGDKVLLSIKTAIDTNYIDILSKKNNEETIEKILKIIFDFIDIYSIKISLQDKLKAYSTDDYQSPYEVLDVFESLMGQLPNNRNIIKKLFSSLGPIEGSLNCILNSSKKFTKETWSSELLPILRDQIDLMKFQGVSGIQREQTVVDCVRECARLFYLDNPKSLTSENTDIDQFTNILFFTIIEAIRHGYNLQILCSIIILNHLPSSIGWFSQIVNGSICYNLKTSRFIFDIFLQLLGFTEVEESQTIQSLKVDHMQPIFHQLVSLPNPVAFALISTCLKFKQAKQFLIDNPLLVNTLIQSIRVFITELNSNNVASLDRDHAESITELIKNLFPIVHPGDSNFLFSISLKVLLLVPKGMPSSYGDEELSKLINRIPLNVPLSLSDVELGLEILGTESKSALCNFSPNYCILDKNEAVRSSALQVLSRRPDLVKDNIPQIINSIKTSNNSIYEMELLLSASPIMPIIFDIDRSYTLECLDILYKTIKQSALRDSMNHPNVIAIQNTEYIINRITQDDIIKYIGKSSLLISILLKLKKFSTSIRLVYKDLRKKGYINDRLKENSINY